MAFALLTIQQPPQQQPHFQADTPQSRGFEGYKSDYVITVKRWLEYVTGVFSPY